MSLVGTMTLRLSPLHCTSRSTACSCAGQASWRTG